MSPLIFECEPKDFQKYDVLINEMEFDEKPKFTHAELKCSNKIYNYILQEQFNHWYFVSDF